MRRTRLSSFDYLNILLMSLLAVSIIYPFLYILSVSLSDKSSVLRGEVFLLPRGINLRSYALMFGYKSILTGFANTLRYTVVGTVFSVFMTIISAYPLSKRDFLGRRLITKLIVITMVFNAGMIPNYLVVVKLGLFNTMWALVLPTAFFGVYLMMAISFFRRISPALEESAMIDGASVYRILAQIVVPLSGALIAALTLFYSMYHYNSYFAPMLYISDRSKLPIQVILRDMIISVDFLLEGMGLMSASEYAMQSLQFAAITISIIPVLIAYPFVQKGFVRGIMLGSLKG